jgi:hypothetical protein
MHCCYKSLQFSTLFIYSMVTYYPILVIVWLLITLFFIQYYIVRELFKVFVVFYNKFVFTNCHVSGPVITDLSLSLSCIYMYIHIYI